jgi:hypothetical protein
MDKPAALSVTDFETHAPTFETLAPEMKARTMCAGLVIHLATIVFLVFPTVYVPLPLVYHFVCQCIAEPLWTEPFVIEFNSAPGAWFAPTASALTSFHPVATTPGLFDCAQYDFGLGELVVKDVAINNPV